MKRLIAAPLLFTSCLHAADAAKLLESLRAELRSLAKNHKEDDTNTGRSTAMVSHNYAAQLAGDEALKDERLAQTIQTIETIRAAGLSDKVEEICRELLPELRGLTAKREKDVQERIDTTLKSALATGLAAKSAKDLDAPIASVAKLQKEASGYGYYGGRRPRFDTETASALEQTLTTIQDAFLDAGGPQGKRAHLSLERLQSATSNQGRHLIDLMPRSEFAEKIQALTDRLFPGLPKALSQAGIDAQIKDIVSAVKTLDDMEPALQKIETLITQQRELNSYYNDTTLVNQLRTYRRTYEDLRSGGATAMNFATGFSNSFYSSGAELLNPLREQLVKYALVRVFNSEGGLDPKAHETSTDFLERVLEEARKKQDWKTMQKAAELAMTMSLKTVADSRDLSAVQLLLAAAAQERARQWAGAVVSYLSALRSGSSLVPAEAVGDILDRLKKDHPEDYETGTQGANTLPALDERAMRASAMSRALMMHGPSDRLPNGVISVPAAPPESRPENKKAPVKAEEKKEQ